VAFLLEQGVRPENLLLLTFTNKAAREMMGRVEGLLGQSVIGLWGGTFHAVGNRVLRSHADRLGYRSDFTILDREDATALLSACLDEAGIDTRTGGGPKAEVLAEIFSLAANLRLGTNELLAAHYARLVELAAPIEALRQRYEARKRQQGVVDFDDLLGLWLRLIEEDEEVRGHYQQRFQYVLVDEYQDTNLLQADLADLLAARHRNLMAVGDDSQSIYSWRGANYENILRFPQRHTGARIFKIETNYRSTPEILALANAAIAPNPRQFAKELAPVRPSGIRPVVAVFQDGRWQARFVVGRVLELRAAGVPLDRMAVLYRSHFHALELQFELTSCAVPYSITSGMRFIEQAHVKDVAAFLKLVCNRNDEAAFKRWVRLLPGIGVRAADKLWQRFQAQPEGGAGAAAAGAVPTPDAVGGAGGKRGSGLAADLRKLAIGVPRKAAAAWGQWTATIEQIEAPELRDRPAAMIRLVVEAVYASYIEENCPNHRSRLEDLEQLAGFGEEFPGTAEFLTHLALMGDVDTESDATGRDAGSRLQLSTVHQAKGLEFDVVFLPMLCEGLFPSRRSVLTRDAEEEERRLFYVALTRARNELYLSYPLRRDTGGDPGRAHLEPSRFLRSLPAELYEKWC
jgi:DNA helicase-2/ATP-dependent DNA helicase PcrA